MSDTVAPHWLDDAFATTTKAGESVAMPAPEAWDDWLRTLFPRHVSAPFADRHADFWSWVSEIRLGEAPDAAFIGVWPRGGGKSTNAELAATHLGAKNKRRYILYVRETQEMADKSVANIAAMLESDEVARHYPAHADRKVGKYGNSRGWRRERLQTAGGLTVDALGLDTASRGLKAEEQRPDFIILDDIDGKHDTPSTTARKVATITSSILPAGSIDVGVLGIQNLIIADGFFTRLVNGKADYLAKRIVSGPYPAVEGLETFSEVDEETGTRRDMIVAGSPTWAGQDLDTCQRMIDTMGLSAFLKECQHLVTDRSEGLALRYVESRHLEDLTDEEAKRLCRMGRVFGGIDFGAWRFGLVLRAVDTGGVVHEIAEYFSQREGIARRAKAVDAICRQYGVAPTLRLRGDAANPTDIRELNNRLAEIQSPYRVVPVAQRNKERAASVERINGLLDTDAIKYRRGVSQAVAEILATTFNETPSAFLTWRLGYNASSPGIEMTGSRLEWEARHWGYMNPKEGKAQAQDPDDNTADGADLIAADRYGIMSYLRPAKEPPVEEDDYHQPVTPELQRQHAERQSRVSTINQKRHERPFDPDFGEF